MVWLRGRYLLWIYREKTARSIWRDSEQIEKVD